MKSAGRNGYILKKILLIKYGHCYNHVFVLNMFTFEASHEQCDVAQFSQVNLNSRFAIWLLIQKQPSRGVLKKRCSENMQQICREHPCRSVILIKLQSNFIENRTLTWVFSCKFAAYFQNTFSYCNFFEIALRHGYSRVNLLHIFRTPFLKNSSGWLHLVID